MHLKISQYLLKFLDPSWNYNISNVDMVVGWQEIFKRAASKDIERIQQLYPQDIIKFGMFLQEMDGKLNKKN